MNNIKQVVKLNSGHNIPLKGLGLFDNSIKDVNLDEFLKKALDVGYRHFDTAIRYGNEQKVGQSFSNIFNNSSNNYSRQDIFLTSKVYPQKEWDLVKKVEESLKDLQTDYIDLFLLHWPCVSPYNKTNEIMHKPVHQSWQELQKCVKLGYVKTIGVSNFNVQSLLDLLSYCEIKPSVNQIECNPYLQQPDLLDFCSKYDIHVTGYCPIARGGPLFNERIIKQLSEKYKKLPVQIILNFLKNELKISVIPKTQQIHRLEENFNFDDFILEKKDVQELLKLDKNERIIDPRYMELFNYVPVFH